MAVAIGFFVLRDISDKGAVSADFPGQASRSVAVATVPVATTPDGGTVPPEGAAVVTVPEPTVPAGPVTAGASVMVVNANGMPGTAGKMTDELRAGPKFTMVEPGDRAADQDKLTETVIYYSTSVPAAKLVADSLANQLGGVAIVDPIPDPAPVKGELNGATVLLMLGSDLANKTYAEFNPNSTTVTAPVPQPTG